MLFSVIFFGSGLFSCGLCVRLLVDALVLCCFGCFIVVLAFSLCSGAWIVFVLASFWLNRFLDFTMVLCAWQPKRSSLSLLSFRSGPLAPVLAILTGVGLRPPRLP